MQGDRAREVAAFILEPIQGDTGVVIPPKEFLPGVKGLCEENGILFIDEEVQTPRARRVLAQGFPRKKFRDVQR